MHVRRSLLVAHPAERMFDLIEGAEHYPSFLPWCTAARVLERTDDIVAARVTVEVRGFRFQLATRNRKRRPEWMHLALDEGPFSRFEGEWHLKPLGPDGCRIEFALDYDFDRAFLRTVAAAVFDRITNTLVDAFVARADALGPAIPAVHPVPLAATEPVADRGAATLQDRLSSRTDAMPPPAAPVPPTQGDSR